MFLRTARFIGNKKNKRRIKTKTQSNQQSCLILQYHLQMIINSLHYFSVRFIQTSIVKFICLHFQFLLIKSFPFVLCCIINIYKFYTKIMKLMILQPINIACSIKTTRQQSFTRYLIIMLTDIIIAIGKHCFSCLAMEQKLDEIKQYLIYWWLMTLGFCIHKFEENVSLQHQNNINKLIDGCVYIIKRNWFLNTCFQFLADLFGSVHVANCQSYSISIKVYKENIQEIFYYDDNSTLENLHSFIAHLLHRYQIHDTFRLFHMSQAGGWINQYDTLNNMNCLHIKLTQWNILNPNFLLVIPRSALPRAGKGKKRKRSKRDVQTSSKKRKQNRNNKKSKKLYNTVHRLKPANTVNSFRFNSATFDEDDPLFNLHENYNMSYRCKYCCAKLFTNETSSLCCDHGNISFPRLKQLPPKLIEYLTDDTNEARWFRKNVRPLNSSLCFASLGYTNKTLPRGSFKVHGDLSHNIAEQLAPPAVGEKPKFMSIYFYDTENELDNRMNFGYWNGNDTPVARRVVKNLQDIIHQLSPYYKEFKSAIERLSNENLPCLEIVIKADAKPDNAHPGCYNAPSVSQIAAVIPGEIEHGSHRNIILECRDSYNDDYYHTNQQGSKCSNLVSINETHPDYDPSLYVLMFPSGTRGWGPDLYYTKKGGGENFVQYNAYYYNDSTENQTTTNIDNVRYNHDDLCHVCQEKQSPYTNNDISKFTRCVSCSTLYHIDCLATNNVDEEKDWYCPDCETDDNCQSDDVVCILCDKKNSPWLQTDQQSWIACDQCQSWCHYECVEHHAFSININTNSIWHCPHCCISSQKPENTNKTDGEYDKPNTAIKQSGNLHQKSNYNKREIDSDSECDDNDNEIGLMNNNNNYIDIDNKYVFNHQSTEPTISMSHEIDETGANANDESSSLSYDCSPTFLYDSDTSIESVNNGELMQSTQTGDSNKSNSTSDISIQFANMTNDLQTNNVLAMERNLKKLSVVLPQQKSPRNRRFVTCRQYYKYFYQIRGDKKTDNSTHRFGKLFQQKMVDDWAKIEANNLNYIKKKQPDLRRAYLNGLEDAIDTGNVESIGTPMILPSTYYGSPRWYHKNYQDAMAIVQRYGKPDLFITFTCNPNWHEITNNLFPFQTAYDRPDLVARVFEMKKNQLLDDIVNKHVLGKPIAHVHTIEFQKRGLYECCVLIF